MKNSGAMNRENMHCDHMLWVTENNIWMEDTKMWDKEIETSRELLKSMEARLSAYIDLYEKHRVNILSQQQELQQLDDVLQQSSDEEPDMRNIAYHQVMAEKHQQYKKGHAQMKNCHKEMMSMMNTLERMIDGNYKTSIDQEELNEVSRPWL